MHNVGISSLLNIMKWKSAIYYVWSHLLWIWWHKLAYSLVNFQWSEAWIIKYYPEIWLRVQSKYQANQAKSIRHKHKWISWIRMLDILWYVGILSFKIEFKWYFKFLIFREYLIPRFSCFASNCRNIKSRSPVFC